MGERSEPGLDGLADELRSAGRPSSESSERSEPGLDGLADELRSAGRAIK